MKMRLTKVGRLKIIKLHFRNNGSVVSATCAEKLQENIW